MMEQPDECDCDEMEQIKGFINEIISKKDAEWGKKVEELRDDKKRFDYGNMSVNDMLFDRGKRGAEIDRLCRVCNSIREEILSLQSRLAIADKLAEALREIASGGFSNYVMVESAKEVLSLWEQGKKD